MATKADVVRIATDAVMARLSGKSTFKAGQDTFALNVGGWCARFVRQVYEAAANLPEGTWRFANCGSAREMEALFRAAGVKQPAKPQPGDIICLNDQSYWAGHIAIYMGRVGGVETVAENTSAWRGDPEPPGTKFSPLADVIGELSGYFAPLAAAAAVPKVVYGNRVIACDPRWVGDHITVAGAPFLQALGLSPYSPAIHVDTGRAYIMELQAAVPKGWQFIYRDMAQGPRIYVKHQ